MSRAHARYRQWVSFYIKLFVFLVPPDPNRLVLASTADLLSIGTPVYGKHLVFVAGQIRRQLTRAHIPDLQSGIFGGRDEQTRVSRE
jgi:hypothetical protein